MNIGHNETCNFVELHRQEMNRRQSPYFLPTLAKSSGIQYCGNWNTQIYQYNYSANAIKKISYSNYSVCLEILLAVMECSCSKERKSPNI